MNNNKVSQLLVELEASIKFTKAYGRFNFYQAKEKKEIDTVVNQISDNMIDKNYKSYFLEFKIRILIAFYSFLAIISFLLMGVVLILMNFRFDNAFLEYYKEDIFLILLFVFLAIFAFAFSNLMLNISRQKLITNIIFHNQDVVLNSIFKFWKINNIKCHIDEQNNNIIDINNKLKIIFPTQRKLKKQKIIVMSEKNYNDYLIIANKNVESHFQDEYKNEHLQAICKSRKVLAIFKDFSLDFRVNKQNTITLSKNLDINKFLIVIFITNIFSIYAL